MLDEQVVRWLLEEDNPAVRYRTQTEILGEAGDKSPVISWVNHFLPVDWYTCEGLWSTYYLTAIAECGLSFGDIPIEKEKAIHFDADHAFEHSCGDYMRLRALIRLELVEDVMRVFHNAAKNQLPDGGFLCLHRLFKMNHIPKSCVKANMHALMFCAECRKKGIVAEIEEPLLDYFWNHKLFYRSDNSEKLILDVREGWRSIDTFHPFEVMCVGLHNIVEAFCALGFGNDERLSGAWSLLESKKTTDNKYTLDKTLAKSYLPKERVAKPNKWVTFYAVLAEKEKQIGKSSVMESDLFCQV